jgi:hypothetical protein
VKHYATQRVQSFQQALVELQLLKAVPEVNATIATESTKLERILADNGPLSTTPETTVTTALDNLRESLPGGTEESFGKAIDKEVTKAKSVLNSTDPVAINDYFVRWINLFLRIRLQKRALTVRRMQRTQLA